MKRFGYPKEYNDGAPWSDRPMRIVNGKLFWQEPCGWWWSEDGEEFFEGADQCENISPSQQIRLSRKKKHAYPVNALKQ